MAQNLYGIDPTSSTPSTKARTGNGTELISAIAYYKLSRASFIAQGLCMLAPQLDLDVYTIGERDNRCSIYLDHMSVLALDVGFKQPRDYREETCI